MAASGMKGSAPGLRAGEARRAAPELVAEVAERAAGQGPAARGAARAGHHLADRVEDARCKTGVGVEISSRAVARKIFDSDPTILAIGPAAITS